MMFPATMKHLAAVVLEKDADAVADVLLSLGVLHFVDLKSFATEEEGRIEPVHVESRQSRLNETRRRIEALLQLGGYSTDQAPAPDTRRLSSEDIEQIDKQLDRLSAGLQAIRNQQKELQSEILRLQDIERHLSAYGELSSGIQTSSRHTFLQLRTGSLPLQRVEGLSQALDSLPSVMVPAGESEDRRRVILLTLRRNADEVEQMLSRFDWQDSSSPQYPEDLDVKALADVQGRLRHLQNEQEGKNRELKAAVGAKKATLLQQWQAVRLGELFLRVQSNFAHTSRTVLFTGWVPSSRSRETEREIKRVTEGVCYLEWRKAKDATESAVKPVKIPVELKNPRFLKPFEMLVTNFSIPEYGTIDPTPLVAIAYLLMFGLMFADVGHGAVLVLLGIFGTISYRNRGNLFQLSNLVIWCGATSMVSGALFGSYFGMQWLPPLWFNYHGIVSGHPEAGVISSIYDILTLTIYIGITVIAVGILLNWVNLIGRRKWFLLIFDRAGIIGSFIYFSGVWVATYYVQHDYRSLPPAGYLFWLLGVPSLLFLVKAPLEEFVVHHPSAETGAHPDGRRLSPGKVFSYVMDWMLELLEIYTGYLANTLSFMRVAGLGIAHVTLMIAFFQIARMAGGGGYNVISIIILVLGNMLVIALEGLSAGIQSLRLNYYEFFSKYFAGSGIRYNPVSLQSRS